MLQLALILLFLLVMGGYALYAAERPARALAAVLFLSPFAILSISIGVRWDAFKLLTMAMWGAVGLRVLATGRWPSGRRPRLSPYLYFFLVSGVLCTLLNYVDPPPASGVPTSFFRGPAGRPIVQTVSLWLDVSAFLLPTAVVSSWRELRWALHAFLLAAVLLAAYGVYQWFALTQGWPVNPIAYRWSSEVWRSDYGSAAGAWMNVGGYAVPRIYSLGGEPKGLAKTLTLAVSAIVCVKVVRTAALRSWLTSSAALALVLVILVMTFSTAGWITTLFAIPAVLVLATLYGRGAARGLAGLSVLTQIALVVAILASLTGATVGAIVANRFFEREYFRDDPEQATWEYLAASPAHWVHGAGAGGLSFRIRPYLEGWARGSTETTLAPNSYFLNLLGSYGLPGLALFVLFVGGLIRRALRAVASARDREDRANLLVLLAMGFAASVFMVGMGMREFWLVIGMLAAGTAVVEERARGQGVGAGRPGLASRAT